MQNDINLFTLPLALGVLLGALALWLGVLQARRTSQRAKVEAADRLATATQEIESRKAEMLVKVQEKSLRMQEEVDGREKQLAEDETDLMARQAETERERSELERAKNKLDQRLEEAKRTKEKAAAALSSAEQIEGKSQEQLERIAGLSPDDARQELVAKIEDEARAEAAMTSRRIEDEAREQAERTALNLVIQATERVNIQDVVESTVSFIQLPSDEMKGRIIGKEGRNIRALEMATGIDLVVDDTPRSILISSFDPVRREVARIAIGRLVEDGRIHPARIEEVVEKVREEVEEMVEERGHEAAYGLGISDLHSKLARLVGRSRFHTCHGQNLLQHSMEAAMIAGHMAETVGASVDTVHRAGLLHEIGQVDDRPGVSGHPIQLAAELAAKFGEREAVVHAIESLHPDHKPKSIEALLLNTASRLSDARPGARKENLAVFIERLRRLEEIANRFEGVLQSYAVKAGREIRVLVDTEKSTDDNAFSLSKQIARALEKELNYPGQIKVQVIRETRSVRYAV